MKSVKPKNMQQMIGNFAMLKVIARRNILRNRRRTALCISAVGIAVFFIVVMQSMGTGLVDSVLEIVRMFDAGDVKIVSKEFDDDKELCPVQYPVEDGRSTSELAAGISALPGVKAVLPRITAYATLSESAVKHARLWAVDLENESALHSFNISERNNGLKEGRFPAPDKNECMIGAYMAKKAGLSIGDRVQLKTVSAQYSDKFWNPEITGIFEFDYAAFDQDVVIVRFDRLQKLLVLGDGTQQLVVYANDSAQSATLAAEIKTFLHTDSGASTIVKDWRDNYWAALMQQTLMIYRIIFLVFMVLASFLIINTVLMIIHERVKEIGMMGSLGMSRAEIVFVVFLEAVILSALGAFAGCVLGGIATFAGSHFPVNMDAFTGGGAKSYPMSGTLFFVFSPGILIQGFLFGVVIASLCTFIPSLKCAFIKPVEALRS